MEFSHKIYGTAQGEFWWPIGEPFEMEVKADDHLIASEFDLRDLAISALHQAEANSSNGALFVYAVLETTYRKGKTSISRRFNLEQFGSVKDLFVV